MATSVPPVISLDEFSFRMAEVLELGMDCYKETGDISHVELAMSPVKRAYEEVFKEAANRGKMPMAKVLAMGKLIERIEGFIERHRHGLQ